MRRTALGAAAGLLALLIFLVVAHPRRVQAQDAPGPAMQQAPEPSASMAMMSAQTPAAPRITAYTLPPDRDQKARALRKVRLRLLIVNLVYGIVVLLLVLWWKWAPKFAFPRRWSSSVSRDN